MLRFLLISCLFGLYLAAPQSLEVEFSLGGETNLMSVVVDRDNNAIFYHVDETEYFEAVQLLQDYDTGYAATKVESEDACFVKELDKTLEEQVDELVNKGNYTITESVNTTAIPLDDDEQSDVGDRVLAFCDGLPVYQLIFDDDASALRDDSSSEEDSDESSGSGSGSDSDESDSGSGSDSDESDSGSGSDSDESDSGSDSDEPVESATAPALRDSSEEGSNSEEEAGTASPANRQVSVVFRKCVWLFLVAKCFVTTLTVPTGVSIVFPWFFG
ncbi:serine-aspartate repeat-containing protein C-like [Eriocheir sinensis]|uniref:serine-aspartate repeat-containing protein C-like n=1 Tax=Eriocheir sinensis TaxID=95602 RepID=UPI0021C9B1E0|nr:serine-aspartate repeat-containing protein C-like [Eriocheir sinensis]